MSAFETFLRSETDITLPIVQTLKSSLWQTPSKPDQPCRLQLSFAYANNAMGMGITTALIKRQC